MTVPGLDCPQITERLLVPGGVDPAFGPADVDMAQAPHPGSVTATPGAHTHTARISKLALHPRTFRARRGTRVTFRLSAASRVTLTVATKRGKRIKGVAVAKGTAGANALRFRGRLAGKALKPGSYRLILTLAGGSAAGARFKIVR
jgi:hypothetical protein